MVSPTCVGLPNRDAEAIAPPRRRFWRPVHSEDRRARVEGPSEGRVYRSACDDLSCLRRCIRFEARMRDDVPLLGVLRTSAVIGAARSREDTRERRRTDRGLPSNDAPRRAPPSRRPGCLRPPRHVKECSRRDCSLRPSRRLSRSRRPHSFPRRGKCFGWALQGHGAVTRGSVSTRVQTPFRPAGIPCLGLTTQARQRARPARPSTGTDCPARTDAGRSA